MLDDNVENNDDKSNEKESEESLSTEAAGEVPNDGSTEKPKKKTRRGKKRPNRNNVESSSNEQEPPTFVDAIQEVVNSQVELLDTAIGANTSAIKNPPEAVNSSVNNDKEFNENLLLQQLYDLSIAGESTIMAVNKLLSKERKKKTTNLQVIHDIIKTEIQNAQDQDNSSFKEGSQNTKMNKTKADISTENMPSTSSNVEVRDIQEKVKKRKPRKKKNSHESNLAVYKPPTGLEPFSEDGPYPESFSALQHELSENKVVNKQEKKSNRYRKGKKKQANEQVTDNGNIPTTSEQNASPKNTQRKHSKKASKQNDAAKENTDGSNNDDIQSPEKNTPRKRNKRRSGQRNRKDSEEPGLEFALHWEYDLIKKELDEGKLLKGEIRINKKNFKEAYIADPGSQDILLPGLINRNRALEGDEVAVRIFPESESRNGQRTGTVVGILKQVHHRQAVGILKKQTDPQWALFTPRDSRVPRIKISSESCPPNFDTMKDMLYLAEIRSWDNTNYALGVLVSIIGMAGSVEIETKSILMENGLDVKPYESEMLKYFPSLPYTIPEEEIKAREDFRKVCIFTIDPETARDLDDAVSYNKLPNGECEVGVHISDVSHFLKEGTPLDEIVSQRATTTYLIQSVFHMLPVELCRLCSLTPGEDKLAFSVIWKVNADGEFQEPRFTRSVILSCCQMSYEQSQAIIDAPADKVWSEDDLPKLHGGFTPRQVVDTVLGLRPLAVALRDKRFSGGALRIDQPKLIFRLDPETGLPASFSVYKNMECHRLIEELMLLANMAVAKQLRENVPNLALLRCHPPPNDQMMPVLKNILEHQGINLDITSSRALYNTLQQYVTSNDDADIAKGWALSAMLSKPMARAKYFCADKSREEEQWHYALSVPLYTHFTSPIRRYADVIVHRLLASTLNYQEIPEWHPDFVHKLASNCNGKKFSAKRAGEQSSELYLTLYIGMHGPLKEEAIVLDVKDHSFDILVLRTGSTHRLYTNNLDKKVAVTEHKEVKPKVKEAKITWIGYGTQDIKLLSLVTVELVKHPEELKIVAILCRPETFN